MRLGLIEASQNQIGGITDQVMLFCYMYDPTTGKYGLAIQNLLRAAGAVHGAGDGCGNRLDDASRSAANASECGDRRNRRNRWREDIEMTCDVLEIFCCRAIGNV